MSTRSVLVVIAIAGASSRAHAGDADAAARTLVAAQAAAIVDGKDAFAATFTENAFAFIQIPRPASGRDEIADVFAEAMTDGHYAIDKVKVKNLVIGELGSDAAWVTADLVMTAGADGKQVFDPWTVRLTELVVRDGDTWRAQAAHLSPGIADAEVKSSAKTGWAKTTVEIPGAVEDEAHAALVASPKKLAARLAAHKAVTVLGSAPKEKAVGKAKAKKLLGRWSKLTFQVVDGIRWEESADWAWGAANIQAMPANAHGKTAPYQYRLLVLFRPKGDAWEVVSVHYSSPAPATF